jgi:hypothetical protein
MQAVCSHRLLVAAKRNLRRHAAGRTNLEWAPIGGGDVRPGDSPADSLASSPAPVPPAVEPPALVPPAVAPPADSPGEVAPPALVPPAVAQPSPPWWHAGETVLSLDEELAISQQGGSSSSSKRQRVVVADYIPPPPDHVEGWSDDILAWIDSL